MHDEELPPLPSNVLCQVLCDELSALLALIGEMGSPELQEAAKARMFSLPQRAAEAHPQEEEDAPRH